MSEIGVKPVAGVKPATVLKEQETENNVRTDETVKDSLNKAQIVEALKKGFSISDKEEKVLTKRVIIKAVPTFIVTPKEVESEAYIVLGCPMKGKNVYIPLEAEEIGEVAQELFGFSTKDTDFVKQVREYFSAFRIKVEYANNEVSSEEDGHELVLPIDEEGKVIFKKDYVDAIIKYRICLQSKKVAKLPNEIAEAVSPGESRFIAYLLDRDAQLVVERTKLKVRKTADVAFLKLVDSSKGQELNWVTRIVMKGIDLGDGSRFIPSKVRGDVSAMTAEDKEMVVSELRDKYPSIFLRVVSDPNLELRSFIEQAIEIGVMTRTGNVIKYNEEVLGANVDEAIDELKKPVRSNLIVEIKAANRNVL